MAYRVGHAPLGAAEGGWLLALADPGRTARPRLPPLTVDSLDLLAQAGFAHGVLPAIAKNLRRLAAEGNLASLVASTDPKATLTAALSAIDQQLVTLSGQAQMLAYHGRRIAAAIESERLAAVIIKGPVFASRLYPRPADRSFTDIDILAAPAAVPAIDAALARLGFVPAPGVADPEHAEFKWLLPGNDVLLVEVQTDLIHSPSLRAGIGFGYADLVAAGNGDPRDATALLMVAAVHGAAGHQFERLQPVIDVVQAARGAAGAIDRTRLTAVAQATGSAAAVQTALDLAAGMFDVPEARDLAEALGPVRWRGIRRHLVSMPVVLRAQANTAWRDSWRRRWLRDLFKYGGRAATAARSY